MNGLTWVWGGSAVNDTHHQALYYPEDSYRQIVQIPFGSKENPILTVTCTLDEV